jgi:hypothetical protein
MDNNSEIRPFRIDVPQATLDDLRDRLTRVRWTDDAPDTGYGVRTDDVKALVTYWRDGYDWRGWEDRLNEYPQFSTTIDGAAGNDAGSSPPMPAGCSAVTLLGVVETVEAGAHRSDHSGLARLPRCRPERRRSREMHSRPGRVARLVTWRARWATAVTAGRGGL